MALHSGFFAFNFAYLRHEKKQVKAYNARLLTSTAHQEVKAKALIYLTWFM